MSRFFDDTSSFDLRKVAQRIEGYVDGYEDGHGVVPSKERMVTYLLEHTSLTENIVEELIIGLYPWLKETDD